MTRRRFLADEVSGDSAALTGQNAAHLAKVLRARVGQEYEIAGGGVVRVGKIIIVEDERVEFELGAELEARPIAQVTLMAAIFKFDRFEWAVEKATELGVARIVPVIARRTDAHLVQAAAKRVERWRRVAHEASQQARRSLPPDIADPLQLKDAVAMEAGLKILLSELESGLAIRSVLENSRAESVAMAVGPEGGWTDDELQLFAKMKWVSASLGPTILRAETAVVAGLAIVQSLLT